ncbi:ATP synthase subunit I [Thiomicrorhabdus sediminis]|nr:ATP synthase subunit I [Thiomicrorhabdus sediminis]
MKTLDKAVKIQVVIGLLAVMVYSLLGHAVGAAYGMFIGLVNLWMLNYTFEKANKRAEEDPKSGILILYMSAVIRFVLLAVLFVLGLSFLDESQALPVVLTFVVMQLAKLFDLKGKRRLTD